MPLLFRLAKYNLGLFKSQNKKVQKLATKKL